MKIGGYGLYDPFGIGGASRLKAYDGANANDILRENKAPDIKQAFRDMEKDQSLTQYQYFVGNSPVIDSSEDGLVIQKSGFDL